MAFRVYWKICCLKHFSFQSVGSRVFSRRRWHSSLRALTSTRRPMKTHNTANMSSTVNRNVPIHSPARTAQCCHSHTPERTLTGVVAYSDGPQQRRATLAGPLVVLLPSLAPQSSSHQGLVLARTQKGFDTKTHHYTERGPPAARHTLHTPPGTVPTCLLPSENCPWLFLQSRIFQSAEFIAFASGRNRAMTRPDR